MSEVAGRRDPATELRMGLVDALVSLPFASSLADRRLLITLIRQDSESFPDVRERPEARLHIIGIVIACLEHPPSLRALHSALRAMAPEEAAARRACRLIETASLAGLLPDIEIRRARELLKSAADLSGAARWRSVPAEVSPSLVDRSVGILHAFDQLVAEPATPAVLPPALLLVSRAAEVTSGPLAAALRRWLHEQLDFLGLGEAYHEQSSDSEEPPASGRGSLPDAENRFVAGEEVSGHESGTAGQANISSQSGVDRSVVVPAGLERRGADEEDRDNMPSATSTARIADQLPQVWGDVPPRNPNFTGRQILLDRLHADLRVARETAVLPQALHGMGGVGKSQVAIEYVHRHSREYDLIWWIPAEQPGQILASLTKLAQRLNLDVSPEANSAVPAVQEALSTGKIPYQEWLLVFDNAESLQEVRAYFPTGGAGKILVTSRNPEWRAVARALEVDVFTRDESKRFLTTRTPELSEHDADRLAEALGDLPLAVEQAAAWHAATGMPVDEYLRLLEDKRIELLDDTSSPDYQISVAAAWNVSLDKLEEVNLAALQLLQVCSFFAPEPISRGFFAGSPPSLIADPLDETLRDPIKLGRAIRDIQRYALARFDHRNNTLQMHRLVQAVLVGRLNGLQRDQMRRGAHTLLANANPHSPARRTRWAGYQAVRPHAMASRIVESDDPIVQELVYEMVEFLYHWGDHEGCLEFAEEAYRHRLRIFGEDSGQALRLARYLGFVRTVLGHYREADELFRRTLALHVEQFGEEDEGTLEAKMMVAYSHRTAGRFAESRELDEEVYAVCCRIFGRDDPVTLRSANNLGVSYRLTGDFAAARRQDEETYQRRCEVLGSDDVETLSALHNLAIDIRELGLYVESRRRQEETYRSTVSAFGLDNPTAMRAGRNLAVARRKAGDHTGARALNEEVRERLRRRYGEDHPDTMAATLSLAVDLRDDNKLEAARSFGEVTVDRYRRKLGAKHPHTLSARANLAVVLRLLGDVGAAHDSNREILELLLAALGPDHNVTLICATNLASDLFVLNQAQEAYELDTDTHGRSARVLGADHPSTLAVAANLSLDLRALDREQAAELLYADTMTRFRKTLGDRHPATLNAAQNLRADCDVDPLGL
ncbi:hypothetical protein Val02_58690 [Virgisporangium aliadipatigenens]|uniref:NB-ARC domain-containing protein n=1 Tax=Virgisporangium aliadipatigenens TaxID=741659 RepID=A0A8J3YSK6_9ACTN|nr:FxSxx-COOH system tetratricopeptide repeat protein [Virgisporangium aliadipatigenens]GIJ48983.1 hypothetical protein Val02_58690 [Virgisporangium aliadipatigenens]